MKFKNLLILLALTLLSGCASMINNATEKMANRLTSAMLNQQDLEIVKSATPAYLIMVDSILQGDPENPNILRASSKLYGAYTSAFVEDENRAKRLSVKALKLAEQALCLEIESLCPIRSTKLDQIQPIIDGIDQDQQPVLYDFAAAWAGWIQNHTDDWNALAEIPKLKALFTHSIKLNENYDRGGAHAYLGVMESQVPPALGGKPEIGRQHFERALEISNGENLMYSVLFAEFYTRLVFDQALHDQLLNQVIQDERLIKDMILINTLAKARANQLLQESDDFF